MGKFWKGMGHTMCSEVESCAGATTCHIIPRWSNKTERPLVRGFFLVVWLLAICAISFHFYTLLVKFLENEAATSVNYNQEHFEFPDITLCPLPPFSLRTIEHLGLYENYTQAKTPEELEIITARAKIEAHNFIVRCRFNGKTCSFKNFTPMFDPALKQCFLFSPPEDERDIETNGPEYGLDVVLFTENRHKYHVKPVDNPDLVTTEWEQAGVRITVHEAKTRAHPVFFGFDVEPGVMARIALSYTVIGLWQRNVNGVLNCVEERERVQLCDFVAEPKAIHWFNYSREDCYMERIQSLIMEKCKCISEMYEVPGIFCNSGFEHCEKKAKMEKCENELRAEIAKNFQEMVANQCPSLCKMKTYPKFSSSDHWPSQLARAVVVNEIRKYVDKLNKLGMSSTLDEVVEANFAENGTVDWMRDNFLRLNIYADSVRGNRVSESEAYSFVNFLSEVGGMMGLWLGASMLTFCEPMEIIVNILYFAFTRKARLTSDAADESAGGDGEPAAEEAEAHTSSGSKSTSSKCPSKTDKKDGIGDLRAVVSQPILSIAAQLPPPMRIFEDTDYLRNANERLGPQSGLFTLRKQYDTSAESLESESSGRYKRLSASGGGVEPTGIELHPPKKVSFGASNPRLGTQEYKFDAIPEHAQVHAYGPSSASAPTGSDRGVGSGPGPGARLPLLGGGGGRGRGGGGGASGIGGGSRWSPGRRHQFHSNSSLGSGSSEPSILEALR